MDENGDEPGVNFTLSVSDDYSGIETIAGSAESSTGERLQFTTANIGDEHTWAARLPITRKTVRRNLAFVVG